jgi:hypothetical protein
MVHTLDLYLEESEEGQGIRLCQELHIMINPEGHG